MAICKHKASKNGFGAAAEYLTMQHDEKGRLLLDENGQAVPREHYLITGVNCTPETFAALSLQDRVRFRKRVDKDSVDTHQYIISFAPSDIEKGLTLDEVYGLGMAFTKMNFPGHRALVCAHPDGGKQSNNMHVHIVISSMRFEDRKPDPRFMRLRPDGTVKPSEYKAGCAHQDTAALRKHFLRQLNAYCDLHGYALCPEKAAARVTQGEYMARSHGKETRNDQLRYAVADAAGTANSWEDFVHQLKTGYTHMVPVYPPIPYPERKKLWAEYERLNKVFWEWDKPLRSKLKQELDTAFQALKDPNQKRYLQMNREAIASLKDQKAKERLFRKTFQAYAKAACLALKSQNQEDALLCLEQMQELTRRQEGYWQDGWNSKSGSYALNNGTIRSKILWKQITDSDYDMACRMLNAIQEEAALRKERASDYIEQPMPIDVKLTRGEVAFRHPDSERWIRGRRLGADYTLQSLHVPVPKAAQRSRQRSRSRQEHTR